MNNKLKQIICVFLTLILSFGIFAGCSGDDDSNEQIYPGGKTHSISVEKTNDYIIVAGKTDYKIVISPSASTNTLFAVDELNYFMEKATGVKIPVIHETGLVITENSKYIVVGNTELTKSAGITLDFETYGADGYVIKTKGKTVYMGGNDGNGDTFAVYEFLKHTINYGFYTIMTINYDKTQYVNFYNFDIVDIPDFAQRITGTSGWQTEYKIETFMKRYRNDTPDEVWLHPSQLNGYGYFHNTKWWLPPETYKADHPNWYNGDGSEFCYTAHGDEDEYAAMQDALLQNVIKACKRWPSGTNVNITHNDYGHRCKCPTCLEELAKCNQSYSGVIIKFMNDFEEKLNEYVKTNNDGIPRDRTFTIQFFAYSFAIIPPVVCDINGVPLKNSDGTYTIIDEEYRTNENVHVWFAPLDAQFVDALDHEDNSILYERYLAWNAVAEKVDFWIYGTNFKNRIAPYMGINSFVENARMFAKDGNNGLILYEQESSPIGIGFKKLQGYITANISWNINYDVSKLMDDYFKNVFGPAEKTMRAYYDDMTAYFYAMMENGTLAKDVYAGTFNKDLFTKSACEHWLKYTDAALKEIEQVKLTDPERYQTYYDEIINETIFPRYYLIRFYEGEYSSGQANEMKKSLIEDTDRLSAFIAEDYNVWEEYLSSYRREIY